MEEQVKQSVISLRIQMEVFNTIKDVMAYPMTRERIGHYVQELRKSRINRPASPQGMHYKKDTVDVMIDENELTTPFMMEYYADVHNKISSIPGVRRQVMTHICNQAIKDVLESCIVFIKQGDKLKVKDSRAKLTILNIIQETGTVKVEFKKLREEWPIDKLVRDIKEGGLCLMKI